MLAQASIVSGMTIDQRIKWHSDRIERESKLFSCPDETRGAARPVIRDDFEQYPSVSAAARGQRGNVKPDWICQAIRRAGTCAGHRWAYMDDIPADFFAARAGACCPWPYARGNPVIYPQEPHPCYRSTRATAASSLSA